MLKQLKDYLESEKKDKTIFDIVAYGSYIKGKTKPDDIDIAVIFNDGTLKERLNKIQEIKQKLKPLNLHIDIKQITLQELFSSSFLARTGILLAGVSLFNEGTFAEMLGFKAYSLFTYNIKALSHSNKVKFNYLLSGRGSLVGLLKYLNGERIASGAVKLPVEKSLEFEEVLKANNIEYKKKDILEEL